MDDSLSQHAASGIGVLDKAMQIVDVVERGVPLALSELAGDTGIPRATVHRLAVALESHGLIARDPSGRFVAGRRLAVRSIADVARPVLERLRDTTGESAQLYIPRGDRRICVVALESPHSLRTIVPVGASLPMRQGSAAKVFAGLLTPKGWAESVEEREKGVASVSAPVTVGGVTIAAVSVSGPVERTSRAPGRKYAKAVVAAAREVQAALDSQRRLAGD